MASLWLLVAGCWLLFAGYLLVVGCWLASDNHFIKYIKLLIINH